MTAATRALILSRIREPKEPVIDVDLHRAQCRVRVLQGLIEMRKAGRLQGVWCDADTLLIAYPPPVPYQAVRRVRIAWYVADSMVEKFRNSLQPARKTASSARELREGVRRGALSPRQRLAAGGLG